MFSRLCRQLYTLTVYGSVFALVFISCVVLLNHGTPSTEQTVHQVRSADHIQLDVERDTRVWTEGKNGNATHQYSTQLNDDGGSQMKYSAKFNTQLNGVDSSIKPSTLNSNFDNNGPQLNSSLWSFPVDIPFSGYVKNREEVKESGWVTSLQEYLQTLDKTVSPHLNLVFGDFDHRLLVTNWITAALLKINPPLRNILVLSLDAKLCDFLMIRGFPLKCIAVATESVFSPRVRGRGKRAQGQWKAGLMVRLPVLRLISHWGYDVASYDSDAVPIQNPQMLYDMRPDVHVFSSAGTFPLMTSKRWGFTLCAGTLFIRSSSQVGESDSLQLSQLTLVYIDTYQSL